MRRIVRNAARLHEIAEIAVSHVVDELEKCGMLERVGDRYYPRPGARQRLDDHLGHLRDRTTDPTCELCQASSQEQ